MLLLGLMLEFKWYIEQDICSGQHVESMGTLNLVTDCIEQVNTDWKYATRHDVMNKLQHKSDNHTECTKLTFSSRGVET